MTMLFELAAKFQAANAAEGLLLLVLKVTLILAIARLLLAAMPRASAATRHLVATAALIAIIALPLLSVVVPSWHLASPEPASPQAQLKERLLSGDDSATTSVDENRPEVTVGSAISVARTFVPDEPLTALERAINVTRSTWKGMIVVAIGVVASLLFLQMLLGMLGVWHVAHHAEALTQDEILRELDAARDHLGLAKDVRLLRSSRISVPVIWGVFRPVLLLPAEVVTWPAERVRVVLLHELAHLKRYDGLSLLLTRLAVSLFWFHPLAWTLERAGRNDCERACDDLVLASGTKPSEYADHLLAIARSMPSFDPFRSVTLAMSRKSQLEGRLLSILQPQVARRVFGARGVALACALAVAVIVPVAAVRLTAAPADETAIKHTNKRAESSIDVHAEKVEHAIKHEGHGEGDYDEVADEVADEVESIQDYFLAKLGKLDRRADRFARTPRNGEEWYERGYDYYRNERFEEAAAAFKRAAELDYADGKALYNAACSYALMGDANRALPTLQQALAQGWDDYEKIAEDSDFDPVRNDPRFRALLQAQVGDFANRRVTHTVERFSELQRSAGPRDGDEWFEVGLDLLRLRKLDESIAAFQRAIAAGENVSSATYNIACAYSLKKDAANGLAWLDKAIELGFSSDQKLENDPDVAFLRTQPGFAALQEKTDALELRGIHRPEWIKYLLDEDGGDWARVAARHKAAVDKYPTSGRAWFNYGYAALRNEQHAEAITAFQRAVQLEHRIATSSYNVACAYALSGNKDQAFEWLKRAKNAGFELKDYLDDDDDLRSLRRDPRFRALAASVN
jgi:beta-lactamase regulating signal transducer with metallopeptidase domain